MKPGFCLTSCASYKLSKLRFSNNLPRHWPLAHPTISLNVIPGRVSSPGLAIYISSKMLNATYHYLPAQGFQQTVRRRNLLPMHNKLVSLKGIVILHP
jgi:hypothetical protein